LEGTQDDQTAKRKTARGVAARTASPRPPASQEWRRDACASAGCSSMARHQVVPPLRALRATMMWLMVLANRPFAYWLDGGNTVLVPFLPPIPHAEEATVRRPLLPLGDGTSCAPMALGDLSLPCAGRPRATPMHTHRPCPDRALQRSGLCDQSDRIRGEGTLAKWGVSSGVSARRGRPRGRGCRAS
jgi:hypothetical protein